MPSAFILACPARSSASHALATVLAVTSSAACAALFPTSSPPAAVVAAGDGIDTGVLADALPVDAVPDATRAETAADLPLLDAPADAPLADVAADLLAPDAAPLDALKPDALPDVAPADLPALDRPPADVACPKTCPLACACFQDGNGCVVPVCAPKTCGEVDTLMAQWLPKARPCGVAAGCQSFEFPICGSAGCFQAPVGAGNPAVAVLEQIASAAMPLQCPKFKCGCAPPPPSFCFGGLCSFCPPDCQGSCTEILTALVALAKSQGFCTNDAGCQVLPTDLCAIAGLGCYHIALSKFADTKGIIALLAAYAEAKCPTADCDCATPTQAKCSQGKCVGGG